MLMMMMMCICGCRLYHSNALPRRPSIILSSLHVSSLISALGRLYGSTVSYSLLINLYDFAAVMFLVICLMNSMVYEECSTLDTRSVCINILINITFIYLLSFRS